MTFGKESSINTTVKMYKEKKILGDIITSAVKQYFGTKIRKQRLVANGYSHPKYVEVELWSGEKITLKFKPLNKYKPNGGNKIITTYDKLTLKWKHENHPSTWFSVHSMEGYVDKIENNLIYVGRL